MAEDVLDDDNEAEEVKGFLYQTLQTGQRYVIDFCVVISPDSPNDIMHMHIKLCLQQ